MGAIAPVIGYLLDLIDELHHRAFLSDVHFAVGAFDLQSLGLERADEDQFPGVLTDVDEAAGTGEAVLEPAHVDIAMAVDLGHAQHGEIKPAAIVEIKLLVGLDDRIRVDRSAEIERRLRHAAQHPCLCGQGDPVDDFLFVRDRADAFGHADAEVHDPVDRQFHRRAAGDDLAVGKRHRCD